MKLCFRNYLRLMGVFCLLSAQPGLADVVVGSDGEVVVDLGEPGVTPRLLAESILGSDIEILNVAFTGAVSQAGFVSGYDLFNNPFGLFEGVILSNGDVLDVLAPNSDDSTSSSVLDQDVEDGNFYELNDSSFTRDESIIELDFIAPENKDELVIEYVFGSDEYTADTSQLAAEVHDFMAIFVNGVNCATVPVGVDGDYKVGVSSINNESNNNLYIDNVRYQYGIFDRYTSPHDTEMDGFTQVLRCSAPIVAGEINHLEFGIVDASSGPVKGSVDSWAILKAVYTDRLLDSDSDGIPNHLDEDDDNDGIPDVVEGNYDVDGDGLPNGLDADSDGGGGSDSSECPDASVCLDTDGDGIPDFVDIADLGNSAGDSDDDGISDDAECSTPSNSGKDCADHDSDLIPDYSDADSDNDGIGDKEECADTGAGCVDSNGDGIPDYLDVDSRNDADADPDTPADTDEDDAGTDPGTTGDGDGGTDQRVKMGVSGVGAFNLIFLGLLFLSFGLRTVTRVRSGLFSSMTLGALFFGLVVFAQSEQAVADGAANQKISEGFYVGLSLGQSTLEPNVSASPYTLDEDGDLGFKVSAGYGLTSRFSLEGALALLGEAELDPSASIEYQPLYVSGVYHMLGQRSRSVFIRAGLATLNTSSNIPGSEENDFQLMLGLGGEWAFNKVWSARAEIESFDEDASLVSLGIIKHFGRNRQDIAELDVASGLIGEGTVSEFDTTEEEICSDISMETGCFIPTIEEQEDSCAIVAGRIEGIYFELNKADLVPSAIAVLDEAARVLETCPSFKVEIHAYADNVGSEERNLILSRHRAHTVLLHLAGRGIALSRLLSRGFGENNPVSDNLTKEGRALNRRVEFNLMEIGGRELISSDE